MATFERYFIDDKTPHKENYTPFYTMIDDNEAIADNILREFGVDPAEGHIINGHVPVKAKSGESPIRANGKQLVIDGGFAKAYQKTTGIAGYTITASQATPSGVPLWPLRRQTLSTPCPWD